MVAGVPMGTSLGVVVIGGTVVVVDGVVVGGDEVIVEGAVEPVGVAVREVGDALGSVVTVGVGEVTDVVAVPDGVVVSGAGGDAAMRAAAAPAVYGIAWLQE